MRSTAAERDFAKPRPKSRSTSELDRDESRPDGEVVTDQCLLGRVANDHHQDQVEARHLRQRSLARQTKDDEQEAVDDYDAKESAGRARVSEHRGGRQQSEPREAPALRAPLRIQEYIVPFNVEVPFGLVHAPRFARPMPRLCRRRTTPSRCRLRASSIRSTACGCGYSLCPAVEVRRRNVASRSRGFVRSCACAAQVRRSASAARGFPKFTAE